MGSSPHTIVAKKCVFQNMCTQKSKDKYDSWNKKRGKGERHGVKNTHFTCCTLPQIS